MSSILEKVDPGAIIMLGMILVFSYAIFRFLLSEKPVAHENTMRFSALLASLTIVLVVAVFPLESEISSGLIGLAGTIIGYFIRDAAGDKPAAKPNKKSQSDG